MSTHIPPFSRQTISLPYPPDTPAWARDHIRTLNQRLTDLQQDIDTLAGRRGHTKFYAQIDAQGNHLLNVIMDTAILTDPTITVTVGSLHLTLPAQAVGDLLYAESPTTYTRRADVAAGSYFRSGGVGAVPVWSTLVLPNAATLGDVIIATGFNTLGSLADVVAGRYLRSGGVSTVPVWSTLTLPNAATQGDVLIATAANTLGSLADVAAGSYLRSGGVSTVPVWSTLLLPNAATQGDILTATAGNTIGLLADVVAGRYLRSGGVGAVPVWSTLTLPNAATQGDLLTATGANAVGSLADVAVGSVLTSGGAGVIPVWANNPTLGGILTAAGVRSSADPGGTAAQVTLSNSENTATVRSTGLGTILFADAVNRNCLGFLKMYLGATAVYCPVFAAN